jgi:hypothetical protein
VQPDLATAAANGYVFNFGPFVGNGQFRYPKTMFVDNSTNPNQIFTVIDQTPLAFPIAPFTVQQLPIWAEENAQVILYSLGGATSLTTVVFYNTDEQAFVNSAFSPLVPGFNVQAQPPTAKVITNRNFTLVAATAHDIFPAVATARMIRFRNIGQDQAWYQVGVTATGVFANGDKQIDPSDLWTQLPYATAARISFFSNATPNIEAEEISF